MLKPRYRLIFKGKLLERANKTDCIENLARLFKKDISYIEANLFGNKNAVIKNTDEQAVVDRYVKAFHDAGAILVVEEENSKSPEREKSKTSIHPPEPSNAPAKTPLKKPDAKQDHSVPKSDSHKKSDRIGWNKKFPWVMTGIVVMVLIGLGLAGGYFWFQQNILKTDIPQAVIDVENALATEGMIALVHGNIEKTIELETMFLDEPDDKALTGRKNESLLGRLLSAGIDPRKCIQQLLFSFNLNGQSVENVNGYYSLVLLGQFKPVQIRKFIEREYETKPSEKNEQVLLFTKQDIDNCEYSPTLAFYADSARVIVTFPGAMDVLLERLDKKEPAEIALESFRKYRKNMLASAGIFAPQLAEKASSGFIGMFLSQMKKEIEPIQSGFLGLKPELFPMGIMLDVAINSNDPGWVNTQSRKLQGLVDQSKQNVPDNMPSVMDLYNHLNISGEAEQLKIQLLVNKDLLGNIGEVFGEFVGSFFSETMRSVGQEMASSEERLEQSPSPFFNSYNLADLKPFNSIEDMNFQPDWVEGPFGILIDSLTYTKDQQIEITVNAEARQIENLGKGTERISLMISSVQDKEGNELLKKETCGQDRNDLPAYFTNPFPGSYFKNGALVSYRKANAEKKIRLKPEVNISQVSRLLGSISLDLPTRTERILIKAPFKNQVVQDDNVRLRFKEGGPNRLSYELSGSQNHLLAVRALNIDQKVLSSSGGFSMERLWGSGKSVTADYHGHMAFAEVILAKGSVKKEFPFTLNTIQPVQKKSQGPHTFMPFESYTLKMFDSKYSDHKPPVINEQNDWRGKPESETGVGPFNLQLFGVNISQYGGSRGSVKLFAPVIPSLNDNLSAVTISFDEVLLPDGQSIPVKYSSAIKLEHAGGYFLNGVYKPDPEKNYLEGRKDFQFDYKGTRPQTIRGKLTLRLPVTISQVALHATALGDSISKDGYKITVTGIGRGSMVLTIQGDQNRILAFHIFGANDEGIQTNLSGLEPSENGRLANLTFTGIPFRIIMYVASRIESREMPFQLDLRP